MTEETTELVRCTWAGSDPLYQHYHDREWGRPVTSDSRLFEKLCLEGFQSGLAWITILRKRERFREVFHGFDIPRVAAMDETDIERLLQDTGIIRHRGKIASTINNAKRALELQKEFGSLAAYFWRFEPRPEELPPPGTFVAQSDASRRMSKDLRKRGFSFVGPTTAYAFMQAMGMVNDHVPGCFCHEEVEAERRGLVRPK
ncbi:DNA-3-methyladenine glycosylase [Devosia sp. DBB001]|nr:DNA-3-methyladenine glycosylase [Devosia sp. DBB001]